MKFKPVHLVFGGLVLATAIPSLNNLKGFTGEVAKARAEADRIGRDMTELQLSQQEAEQKAAVAIERYQNGCLPVVDNTQTQYVSLQLNQPVIDSVTYQPLPAGTVVCDAHGNTGVMTDDDNDPNTPPVVQKLAFTGDKAAVDARIRQYRGASYGMPTN